MLPASSIVRERQRAIRRELDRRGISLKTVSFDSGIPYSTLCSYFPGNERGSVEKQPAEMPAGAVYSLFGVIPADLLNLLTPDGFAIVQVPSGVDYDDISEGCRSFQAKKDRFHHPDSEAGRDIGPTEQNELNCEVIQLRARVA